MITYLISQIDNPDDADYVCVRFSISIDFYYFIQLKNSFQISLSKKKSSRIVLSK